MKGAYDRTAIDIYKKVLSGKLIRFPVCFWSMDDSREHAAKITRWLVEKKLRWTEDDIREHLHKNIFINNCLQGMLILLFNQSTFAAIDNAYPGKYKRDDFAHKIS